MDNSATKQIPGHPEYLLTDSYNVIGKRGKQLTWCKNQRGDKFCNIMLNGKSNILYQHRAIALVHVEGYFEGAQVDHIDNDNFNNDPDNLRWVTSKENNWINKEQEGIESLSVEDQQKIADIDKQITALIKQKYKLIAKGSFK